MQVRSFGVTISRHILTRSRRRGRSICAMRRIPCRAAEGLSMIRANASCISLGGPSGSKESNWCPNPERPMTSSVILLNHDRTSTRVASESERTWRAQISRSLKCWSVMLRSDIQKRQRNTSRDLSRKKLVKLLICPVPNAGFFMHFQGHSRSHVFKNHRLPSLVSASHRCYSLTSAILFQNYLTLVIFSFNAKKT